MHTHALPESIYFVCAPVLLVNDTTHMYINIYIHVLRKRMACTKIYRVFFCVPLDTNANGKCWYSTLKMKFSMRSVQSSPVNLWMSYCIMCCVYTQVNLNAMQYSNTTITSPSGCSRSGGWCESPQTEASNIGTCCGMCMYVVRMHTYGELELKPLHIYLLVRLFFPVPVFDYILIYFHVYVCMC